MKFEQENRLFIKGLTFLPPVLGIMVFSYIVKFSNFPTVHDRLPLYQGITSYFSLILIGFTYIRNRSAVGGKKIMVPLLLILFLPVIFYYFVGADFLIALFFCLASFLNTVVLYLLLLKQRMIYYVIYSAANSVTLPLILIFNIVWLGVFIILMFVMLIYILQTLKDKIAKFHFSESGFDILKSILLHSPFLILPFFDFKIQQILGESNYSNYVLLNKYINGGITVLFSYQQLSLIFTQNLEKIKQILVILMGILLISSLLHFFNNRYIFAVMLALFSLGVNLSSLVIRNKLMQGVSFLLPIIGVFFVLIYFLGISILGEKIHNNPNIFVLLMTCVTILVCLLDVNYIKASRKFLRRF